MDFFRQNAVAIISAILAGGITYGSFRSDVLAMKQQQDILEGYTKEVITMKADITYLQRDVIESTIIWNKLDDTLKALNVTLAVQGNEIKALKEEVQGLRNKG